MLSSMFICRHQLYPYRQPMAGDTWQILQRHLLHPLVAQALEGRQRVLGAERRCMSEV